MHVIRRIKSRHPEHARRIDALLLSTSAITLLAGIALLPYGITGKGNPHVR